MYVEFDTPEILEHLSGFPGYWMKTLFIQSASDRFQINALTSTYVRLVEAALVEYSFGVVKLKEYWGTHTSINLRAMHRAMSHFETCISNMYRATNCFRRLRRDSGKDPLSIYINVERANFASDVVAKKFKSIRNEIHHLEEKVMNGNITMGQNFALFPDGPEVPHPTEANQTIKTIDRLIIGSKEIKLSELAALLTEMAEFANKITEFIPNTRQSKP